MKERPDPEACVRAVWHVYVGRVLPATASPEQIAESRRAYVAGARMVLGVLADSADPVLLDAVRGEVDRLAEDQVAPE